MPIKVLIADDNIIFRKLIAQYLQKQPGVVVVGDAVDGEEAVRKAKELLPDIVLLDISMPKQPSATATSDIKKASPGTNVYLCSAHSDETLHEIAAISHANGFARKSSLKADLLEIVQSELQKKN
jgi:two-component system response regulator NreC